MRLVVARENQTGETRVAIVPAVVGKLLALGYEVLVEPGAGEAAGFADRAYEAAGAQVDPAAVSKADLVVGVRSLDLDGIRALRRGAAQISFLDTSAERGVVEALANRDFGRFFRLARTHLHATQEQLGLMVGLAQSHVCKVESGGSRLRDIEAVVRVASALRIPAQLLGFAGRYPP